MAKGTPFMRSREVSRPWQQAVAAGDIYADDARKPGRRGTPEQHPPALRQRINEVARGTPPGEGE
jgi:hypothetical protein